MRRTSALALGLVVVGALVLGSGCSKRGLAPGEARVQLSGGDQARARSGPGPWKPAQDDQVLRRGDRMEALRGTPKLELARDRAIELRPLADEAGRPRARVELQAVPRLETGEALLSAPMGSITLRAADAQVSVRQGSARVSQSLGNVVAASYEGSLKVSSTGRSLDVPALRQTTVAAAGLVPLRPSPLRYDRANPFDTRKLGDAIDLGAQLQARIAGFTANLRLAPGEGTTPGFYRELLPPLEREADLPAVLGGVSQLNPAETLVGATIVTEGRRGGFGDRWRATFGFRTEGAEWGLVALDQRVGRSGLLSGLDRALGVRGRTVIASPLQPTPPPPTLLAGTGGGDGVAGDGSGGPGLGGSGAPAGGGGGSGGGSSPTVPPPELPVTGVGPSAQTVVDTITRAVTPPTMPPAPGLP